MKRFYGQINDYPQFDENTFNSYEETKPKKKKYILNIILFIATFITCLVAGTQWANKNPLEIQNWHNGVLYAILILTFLSSHEFGHYFASRHHKVDSTLPFFIPAIFPDFLFGTFGAVIKTRSPIRTRKALFDIGISGPLAGFVVCLAFLVIGFATLPPMEFIYTIHPNYMVNKGAIPPVGIYFGDTLLFSLLSGIFSGPGVWIPPMNEIYHYPFLCVGWFGLFVTALNLLPIGQLDGGHILYSMIGDKQGKIARVLWWIMFLIGFNAIFLLLEELFQAQLPNTWYIAIQDKVLPFVGWLKNSIPLYFTFWGGWLFWSLMTRIFIKIDHPDIVDMTEELGRGRMILGYLAFIILILSISYNGIYIK